MKVGDISAARRYAEKSTLLENTPGALQVSHEALQFIHSTHAYFSPDLCTELNPWTAKETRLDIVFADSNGVKGFLILKNIKFMVYCPLWNLATYPQKFKDRS